MQKIIKYPYMISFPDQTRKEKQNTSLKIDYKNKYELD